MNFESQSPQEIIIKSPDNKFDGLIQQEKKEVMFKAILVSEMRNVLKEAMEESGISDEAISDFFNEVASLTDDEALAVMAIPHELQRRVFNSFKQRFETGKIDAKGFVEQLRNRVIQNGYQMGFHVSNNDLEKTVVSDGKDKLEKWDVSGTEKDHRDDDLLRAYYSLDYLNLYRKKSGKYLYVVRVETGPNSSHRMDNNGAWGRASTLPIVGRLDLVEVDKKIENGLKDENGQELN